MQKKGSSIITSSVFMLRKQIMYPWKEAFASFKCHWSTKPSLQSISLSKTFSSICHEVLFMWKRLQGKYDYYKFWNAENSYQYYHEQCLYVEATDKVFLERGFFASLRLIMHGRPSVE